MTDVITSDNIASVSLTDADRDPEGFAQELGPELRRIWLRDRPRPRHSGGADRPRRGEGEGLLRAARGGEAQLSSSPAAAGRAATRRSGSRPPRARTAYDLKEFWHVGRDLPPGHPFRDVHGRQCLAGRSRRASRTPSSSSTTRSTQAGLKILARDRPLPRPRRGLFRRHGARRQFGAAPAPLSADQDEPTGNHIRAGAHEDINTITLLLGAEEAGLELLDQGRPLAPGHARSRASWWSISATCCSG